MCVELDNTVPSVVQCSVTVGRGCTSTRVGRTINTRVYHYEQATVSIVLVLRGGECQRVSTPTHTNIRPTKHHKYI